jgi:hypothetical protein
VAPTEAAGSGSAFDCVITLAVNTTVATTTAAAFDATVLVGGPGLANAATASATATAYNARPQKLYPRPNTGTVTRPNTGTIIRPFTGTVSRP